MEIVIAALVAAAVAGIVVMAGQRRGPAAAAAGSAPPAEPRSAAPDAVVQATATAPKATGAAPVTAGVPIAASVVDPGLASELQARRAEIARIEERLLSKEESLDVRLTELERKERSL